MSIYSCWSLSFTASHELTYFMKALKRLWHAFLNVFQSSEIASKMELRFPERIISYSAQFPNGNLNDGGPSSEGWSTSKVTVQLSQGSFFWSYLENEPIRNALNASVLLNAKLVWVLRLLALNWTNLMNINNGLTNFRTPIETQIFEDFVHALPTLLVLTYLRLEVLPNTIFPPRLQ